MSFKIINKCNVSLKKEDKHETYIKHISFGCNIITISPPSIYLRYNAPNGSSLVLATDALSVYPCTDTGNIIGYIMNSDLPIVTPGISLDLDISTSTTSRTINMDKLNILVQSGDITPMPIKLGDILQISVPFNPTNITKFAITLIIEITPPQV